MISFSSVSTLSVHVLWQRKEIVLFAVSSRTGNKLLATQRNEKYYKAKIKSTKVPFIHYSAIEAGATPEEKHPSR